MLKIASDFYKNFFAAEARPNISLENEFWDHQDLLTNEEFEISEDEILDAIKNSSGCGAPGPDGFSFLFYQTVWHVIKKDFMALVKGF